MASAPTRLSNRKSTLLALAISLVALVGAGLLSWMCDDAFVSFRYAENLVEGRGLVFNPGERVEGMTNIAWTLWVALGMLLQVSPEAWSAFWGIAAYALGLGLLFAWERELDAGDGGTSYGLPIALLIGAAHPDWRIWATSGLETSAFTTAIFAGHLLIARGFDGQRAPMAKTAGATMALAALLRPDGVAFAFGGLVVLLFMGAAESQARRKAVLSYLLTFTVVWGACTAARVGYYGDFFPNTYYAKSGGTSWWSQGLRYLSLYAERYWVLLPFVLLAPALAWRKASSLKDPGVAHGLSAACYVLGYALYVGRVGGDFMFARFLIPITPFLALCAALVLRQLQHPQLGPGVPVIVGLAMLLSSSPVVEMPRWGVGDERAYWTAPNRLESFDKAGNGLGEVTKGLPVVLAHPGAFCRIIYRSRVGTSIDAQGGLTDPVVARRPIKERGRPGHEKLADYEYLRSRGVHFVASGQADQLYQLRSHVPAMPLYLNGVEAWVIRWDPEIMRTLAERGVKVPDFDAQLDRWVAELESMPRAEVERLKGQLGRFYFEHVEDPREAAFERRLAAD